MNQKKIFETVVTALVKQGSRSARGMQCLYRDDCGKKCAIGHLMKDSVLDKYIKEHGEHILTTHVSDTEVQEILEKSGVKLNPKKLRLLEDLQYTHDFVDPKNWKSKLREVAIKHKIYK